MRRRAPALIGVLAALCASAWAVGLGISPAGGTTRGEPPPTPVLESVLLVDAGPGFTLDAASSGPMAGGYQRTFRHAAANLQLIANPLFPGSDPDEVVNFLGAAFAGQYRQVPVALEHAQAFELVQSDAGRGDLLVFASRADVFAAILDSGPDPGFDPQAFLVDLAERQIAAAGGPPDTAGAGSTTLTPAEQQLDAALLATPPPSPAGGTFIGGEGFGGNDPVAGMAGLDDDVSTFLDRSTVSRARAWADMDSELVVAVGVTRYPYDLFAAAALDWQRNAPDTRRLALSGLRQPRHVVSFEGTGERAGTVGAAFRRGDLLYTVLARTGTGPAPADPGTVAAVTAFVDAQLDVAPEGAMRAYGLPSPSWAGLISAAVVTALGATCGLLSRARAHRRHARRLSASPSGRVASSMLDVSGDARRLRRRGVALLGAQLVALAVAVAGVVAFTGVGALVAGVSGPALGIAVTGWWRRREIDAIGLASPAGTRRARPAGFAWSGAVVGVVALALLGVGGALGVSGIRAAVGLPTLRMLQFADVLAVAPRPSGGLAALAGLVLVLAGGALFRLARKLARADAGVLLRRDRRPPILYLRSFEDDVLTVPSVVSARRPFLELFTLRATDPYEEAVTWELAPYGPVVAIGQPGQSLASLGAAREYLPDGTWRQGVTSLMGEARAVIVSIGETPGLEWEIEKLVGAGHLAKTLFLFPPAPRADLERRWASSCHAVEAVGGPPVRDIGDVGDVCTVAIAAGGQTTVVVADRRDEAAYRSAVDRAIERLLSSGSDGVESKAAAPGAASGEVGLATAAGTAGAAGAASALPPVPGS